MPDICSNLSEAEQVKKWSQLKRKGVYETELGDLDLQAIAKGNHKDILVFNTNIKAHSRGGAKKRKKSYLNWLSSCPHPPRLRSTDSKNIRIMSER